MLRVLIVVLALMCPGCAAVQSSSRQRQLRSATIDLRRGMTSDEVLSLLGPPTIKDGASCNFPGFYGRTCQRWTYDPSKGWPLQPPNNRLFRVFLMPNDGRLYLVTWKWD